VVADLRRRLGATRFGRSLRRARRALRSSPWATDRRRAAARRRWVVDGSQVPAPPMVKHGEVVAYTGGRGPHVFIETGTLRGDTIEAVRRRVDRVVSIELSPQLAVAARMRFADNPEVTILEGDSGTVLPQLIDDLDEPAVFWLDGHFSAGPTARADLDTPIVEELEAVLTHDRDDHVVLIDDARLFGTGDYPTIDQVRAQVARHRPHWQVDVHTDIIRAHRPDVHPR